MNTRLKFFINHYGKWITILLILLGFFLIGKVWFLGFYIKSSYGLLDGFYPWYAFWGLYAAISYPLLIIAFHIYTLSRETKDKYKKFQLGCLILLLGLLARPLLYVIEPGYRLYYTKGTHYFLEDGKFNLDKFLELSGKYCGDDAPKVIIRGYSPSCFELIDKDYLKINTIEEYIKVLEYAKEHSFSDLYRSGFGRARRAGVLEELIREYNDKSFYVHIIRSRREPEIIDLILQQTNDVDIIKLINFYREKSAEFEEKKQNGERISGNYWDERNTMVRTMVHEMPGINWIVTY